MIEGIRRQQKVRPVAAVSGRSSKKDPPATIWSPLFSKIFTLRRHRGKATHPVPPKSASKDNENRQQVQSSKIVAGVLNLPEEDVFIPDIRQMASMYDTFLNVNGHNDAIKTLKHTNNELMAEHRKFKSSNVHFTSSIIVALVIFLCVMSDVFQEFFSPRASASSVLHQPVEIASLVVGLVAAVLFMTSYIHRFVQTNDRRDDTNAPHHSLVQRVRDWLLSLDQSSMAVRLVNDSFVVFLTLFAGLASVARVAHVDCNDHYSQLMSGSGQTGDCDEGAVAMESYAMCMFVVLLPQVFFKGASRTAICLSW